MPEPSVVPLGEPGVSGDFWGSQEGCQGCNLAGPICLFQQAAFAFILLSHPFVEQPLGTHIILGAGKICRMKLLELCSEGLAEGPQAYPSKF